MYTTHTASREQGLEAAAAAMRAMGRHECCKSQFKFKCFSCGEMINRGDKITKCTTSANDGMDLRFRGADCRNGLTMGETAFYMGEYGSRSWVHIGCEPVFWDPGPRDLTPEQFAEHRRLYPDALCRVFTDWSSKINGEFHEWCGSLPANEFRSFPLFCQLKGYPKNKLMKDRIIHAVIRFQAIWRGYLYKAAYPEALRQKKLSEEIEDAEHESGRRFLRTYKKGRHFEYLFDRGKDSEAIFSGEILSIVENAPKLSRSMPGGLVVWVVFHHDYERKRYHWKRFLWLENECKNFKSNRRIQTIIKGKLPTGYLYNYHSKN